MKWPLLMAANVMSLLPMLLVFIGAQRYFVQSVASTGTEGLTTWQQVEFRDVTRRYPGGRSGTWSRSRAST